MEGKKEQSLYGVNRRFPKPVIFPTGTCPLNIHKNNHAYFSFRVFNMENSPNKTFQKSPKMYEYFYKLYYHIKLSF